MQNNIKNPLSVINSFLLHCHHHCCKTLYWQTSNFDNLQYKKEL